MSKIIFKSSVSDRNFKAIKKEFPHFELLKDPLEESWIDVEIAYTSSITTKELKQANRLRWIHTPTNDIEGLAYEEIIERGDILLSTGSKTSFTQAAEFVLAGILLYAKQLHLWPQAPHSQEEFWQWPLKETMWSLKDKRLLQVGSGKVGQEVTRLCSQIGMTCWAVGEHISFQPYTKKNFIIKELHSILPSADVIIVANHSGKGKKIIFKKEELALISSHAILIVVDQPDSVDLMDLILISKEKKWRGVIIDALSTLPPLNSPIWSIPNLILTPNIASYPKEPDEYGFNLFRKNLRAFVSGKISEMRNVIMDEGF